MLVEGARPCQAFAPFWARLGMAGSLPVRGMGHLSEGGGPAFAAAGLWGRRREHLGTDLKGVKE